MNSMTALRSWWVSATGRQMRTCELWYLDSGTEMTPSSICASTSTCGSPASVSTPGTSPTYMAECDQVDCVRYLMMLATRLLPSTSSTSPGCSTRDNALGSGG